MKSPFNVKKIPAESQLAKQKTLSWRRLKALCWKEILQITRDPSSIIIAVILPIALLLIFGFGINLDSNKLYIGMVTEDNGVFAKDFVAVASASPYLQTTLGHSRREMQTLLDEGKIDGMMVIPNDFSTKVTQGLGEASIQVIVDGSQPNIANFVVAYAQGVWQVWNQQLMQDKSSELELSIEPIVRYWFNPTTVSRNYLIPGSISVIVTIIGALLTSMVVAREWERGTMEALLSTPVSKPEFLLSKIIPYYILAIISTAICILIATLLMEVPLRGSLLLVFLCVSLYLGSALGMGLLISTVTRNQFHAAEVSLNAAFLPTVLLSGFMFEIASMPQVIQFITYFVPARYFVSILQTIFQAGNVWGVIIINMGYMLLLSLFWLGLVVVKTRRRLDG